MDIGGKTGNWHRKLNATIGYSNPIEIDIWNRMQYYSGENIFAENRIRYAQRGDYACLDHRAGSTGLRGIVE